MNESSVDRQRELMAMTPHERLELARKNPISRGIVLEKDKRFLETNIDVQISCIERQLPDSRIDATLKRSAWALAIGPLLVGLVSWILCQFFGAPQGLSATEAAARMVLAGMLLGSLDLIRDFKLRRSARELADTYGVSDVHGANRCLIAAHLWMARMDSHLELLTEGVARANATSPEDPHLHAARSILNELRGRQNADFAQLYRRQPIQRFYDVRRRRTEEISTTKLIEQGLALLAKVGASQHTETAYRGLRIAADAGKTDLRDTAPATASTPGSAHKNRK